MKRIAKTLILGVIAAFFAGFFLGVQAADRARLTLTRASVAAALAAEADYEEDSFAAFSDALADLGGLAAIDAMIADDLASQETVDALDALLLDALAGLTLQTTHQEAMSAYDAAFALLSDENYTSASRSRLESALVAAWEILDEPTSGEAAVAAVNAQILLLPAQLVSQAVMDDLVLKNNLAISRYYEDRNAYTVSSHDAFKAAVDAYGGYLSVQELMADPAVTETQLTDQIALIDAAFLLLDPRGNTDLLEAEYDIAAERALEAFIPASVTAYQNELVRILAIINSPDQNQTQIDAALGELLEAENLLIPFADKTGLAEAIGNARDVREERYTVTSYYQLSLLLDQAVALNEDPDALQTVVDQLVLEIESAIDDLVVLPDQIEFTVGKAGINLGSYVAVGDSQIIEYVSSNPLIATVDAAGNVTPIQFGTTIVTVRLANGVEEVLEVFVKEKIRPLTLVLLGGIPVVAIGIGVFMVLLSKGRPAGIVQRVRKNQMKPKKTLVTKDGITEIK